MDTRRRLFLLSGLARYECELPDLERYVYRASTPAGRRPLLKIMQTTCCDKNCAYCIFRRDREETPRIHISPKDLAEGFMELYRRGRVSGLFLTAGLSPHPEVVMERMIDTALILRRKHRYRGYIHLKIMPGVSDQTLEAAVAVADRVSVNVEAPKEEILKSVARGKSIRGDILPKMERISDLLKGRRGKSQTTQIIVGLGEERDEEILRSAEFLYRRFGLSRVYYSPFQPVRNTPLEGRPPAPESRAYRLYQADTLIREYGFSSGELVFEEGNLPADRDPKSAWAERNAHLFPVEINSAELSLLLRVPGIGRGTAWEIIRRRREKRLKTPEDLKGLKGVRKILRYVLLDGRFYGR